MRIGGKTLFIFFVALICLVGFGGNAMAAGKVTVGFSMPFIEDSPYCFPLAESMKKEAAARGWNLILTDAKGDLNTQINQIEDLVSKGVAGVMIMPLDAAGIVPVIKKMYAQTKGKMPIMASNSMTDPRKFDALVGFSGPDCYTEGKALGEYYVNYFKSKGVKTVNYCEVTGVAGSAPAIDRRRGFEDRIRELGWADKFILFDLQPGDWSSDKAQKLTENWITTYGSKIQMIYAHNDGMGIGVVKALQDAGKQPGEIITNGCDGQIEAVELIQQGWMLFTLFQSPAIDAATSMKAMEKILKGQKTEYFNIMETPVIEKKNADKYLPIVTEIWGMK